MYFCVSIASILLLLALENFEPLQFPFATRFVQYLGDISFSLYILHFPLMLTIGRTITVDLIKISGSKSLGVCLGGLILTPILFWISDVHWRIFDENSIKFAKWLAVQPSFEKAM
jgi:peptidoglycan/LPS O-acetylase OafA/YrhL